MDPHFSRVLIVLNSLEMAKKNIKKKKFETFSKDSQQYYRQKKLKTDCIHWF